MNFILKKSNWCRKKKIKQWCVESTRANQLLLLIRARFHYECGMKHSLIDLSAFEKKHRADDHHDLGSKPTCARGKDTLWHFPLLGDLGKQF